MNNINRLFTSDNKNCNLFTDALLTLCNSQGFYSRLYRSVNKMNPEEFDCLVSDLEKQDFIDTLDVILWIES